MSLKIVFHKDFLNSYDYTPAGKAGRLDPTFKRLEELNKWEVVEPVPALLEHIREAHSQSYIDSLTKSGSSKDRKIFKMAQLSAGGAISCAQLVLEGTPAFGLIRPPGHHASKNSAWGFCYLNNIAIALLYLRNNSDLQKAFVLDFDLHLGDGNLNILQRLSGYEIYNPDAKSEEEYLEHVQHALDNAKECDIICASAGFDQGSEDWGALMSTTGYKTLGEMMKKFAEEKCNGYRFALLEGGYNPANMADNIVAFLEGFG